VRRRPSVAIMAVLLMLAPTRGFSDDEVVVRDWVLQRESSRFLAVAMDSIWTWDVDPGGNLSPGLAGRHGSAWFETPDGPVWPGAAAAIHDGDGTTALDPDAIPEVGRLDPLLVDLGTTFRVNRIRLYPRLDVEHRTRFLENFSVRTAADSSQILLEEGPLSGFGMRQLFSYGGTVANTEPVVDREFRSRDVRYVLIQPQADRQWEIAELEVYGDGTLPAGEYISLAIAVPHSGVVWNRVRYEGGDIADAPFVVQTRVGPNPQPWVYALWANDEPFPVQEVYYWGAEAHERVPITPNPEWSGWETVTNSLVQSPSGERYMQFRVELREPGTVLRELSFEYVYPPMARTLEAEISPVRAQPGVEQEFTLSLLAHLRSAQHSGFRLLEVLTSAAIGEVIEVLVNDEPGFATTSYQPGQGMTINLWRRVRQSGTFIQVRFTATVFRDGTRFQVRTLDRRDTGMAYQVAREADIDLVTAGGQLVVRLTSPGQETPLLAGLNPGNRSITPNGDGINDRLDLTFALLKLVGPVPLSLDIYRMDGTRVRRAFAGMARAGTHAVAWDGVDEAGSLVPPGVYLYELRVESGAETERVYGTVGVSY
jgi:flagellar hook capping protein FlgD